MVIIYCLYLLFFIIFCVAGIICIKIKSCGLNVKDFFDFIFAINDLDNLYVYAKNNINMTEGEQLNFLKQAESLFTKFEKIPSMIWEEEYEKYIHVLETYKSIKMLRWSGMAV